MSLQSAKVYKRYSSVIPSSHILDEVHEVQPGRNRPEVSALDRLNGIQAPSEAEVQRSTLVFGRPSTTVAPAPAPAPTPTTGPPKVQLRTQRPRHVSRPISMPLERLPTPAQMLERNTRNAADCTDGSSAGRDTVTETIQEMPELEKTRSSRVSTYYITPFIDTQTMQRRTWDRKYKHYDVTPRTAMIVANLPSAGSGVTPVKATMPITVGPTVSASVVSTASTVSTVFSNSPYTMSVKPTWTSKRDNDSENSAVESSSSPKLPLTLRAPRTLQPPPGTFYKPPASVNSRARTLPNWTTTVTTVTTTTTSALAPTTTTTASSSFAPSSSPHVASSSSPLTSPKQTKLQTQDSTDSAIDPGVSTSSTLSPPQSPSPSSPDDLSPSETKPVYQRLRPRRHQELEHREAHFV